MSKPLIVFLLIVIVYLSTLPTIPVHGTIFNTVNNEPEATVYESLTTPDGYYFYIETHYPHYTGTEVGWWNYMDVETAKIPFGADILTHIAWWRLKIDHSLWDSWAYWWEGEEPFDEYTDIEPLNPEKCAPQPGFYATLTSIDVPILGSSIIIPGFTYVAMDYSEDERMVVWGIASYDLLQRLSQGYQEAGVYLGVYIEPEGQYYESLIMYEIKMGKIVGSGAIAQIIATAELALANVLPGDIYETPELGDGIVYYGYDGYDEIIPVEIGD